MAGRRDRWFTALVRGAGIAVLSAFALIFLFLLVQGTALLRPPQWLLLPSATSTAEMIRQAACGSLSRNPDHSTGVVAPESVMVPRRVTYARGGGAGLVDRQGMPWFADCEDRAVAFFNPLVDTGTATDVGVANSRFVDIHSATDGGWWLVAWHLSGDVPEVALWWSDGHSLERRRTVRLDYGLENGLEKGLGDELEEGGATGDARMEDAVVDGQGVSWWLVGGVLHSLAPAADDQSAGLQTWHWPRPIRQLAIASEWLLFTDSTGEIIGLPTSGPDIATGGTIAELSLSRYQPPAFDIQGLVGLADGDFVVWGGAGRLAYYRRHLSQGRERRLLSPDQSTGMTLLALPASDRLLLSTQQSTALLHLKHAGAQVSLAGLFGAHDSWQTTTAGPADQPDYNVLPLLFGSFKAALLATLIAAPIAIFTALQVAFFSRAETRAWLKPALEQLEALPTVVLGFVAAVWLAPKAYQHLAEVLALLLLLPAGVLLSWRLLGSRYFQSGARLGANPKVRGGLLILLVLVWAALALLLGRGLETWWFGADLTLWLGQRGLDYQFFNVGLVALALGFSLVPVIFALAEDAIYSVPANLITGSLALGATAAETAVKVVLPMASSGIVAALLVGFGRAVGETMIVLMASGNTPLMDWSLFRGIRSIAATLAIELPEAPAGATLYQVLLFLALLLFLITLAFNTLAEFLRQRLAVHDYRVL